MDSDDSGIEDAVGPAAKAAAMNSVFEDGSDLELDSEAFREGFESAMESVDDADFDYPFQDERADRG